MTDQARAEAERVHGNTKKAADMALAKRARGELTDGILDQLAKFEMAKTAERTRRGKLRKAREGKLVGSGPPLLGFKYTADRTGYVVDEETMPVVRRIFRAVGAEGSSMWAAGRALEKDGVMAPSGGRWHISMIRRVIGNDCYRPHAHEEVGALVSPIVAAGLDKHASYGLWHFGKERITGPAKGRRTHRKNPREEWIAVPVPDAGIPREWVDRARESVEGNVRPAFGGGRLYELAGGIAYCGECGLRMTTHQIGKAPRTYFYYACPTTRKGKGWGCANPRHRAEALEGAVVEAVDGELIADPERLAAHADAAIERERAASRGTAAAGRTWAEKIAECDRGRAKNQEMFRADAMTLEELGAANAALDEERGAAEEALRAAARAGERLAEMEEAKRAALEVFGTGLMAGVQWFPPALRHGVYALLGLRVTVFTDRTVQARGHVRRGPHAPHAGGPGVRGGAPGGRGAAASGGAREPRPGPRGEVPGPRGQPGYAARVGRRGADRQDRAGARGAQEQALMSRRAGIRMTVIGTLSLVASGYLLWTAL